MSQDARSIEEQTTERRAQILGLSYINTAAIESKQLYPELLEVPELYSLRVIPIQYGQSNLTFGITNTTSQQTLKNLQQRFADNKVSFGLISDTGFNDYMKLYDPPPTVTYRDIDITPAAQTGEAEQMSEIAATLQQVRADDMLAYLVKQAYRLKASDIHLETGRGNVRIRLRVDGVLHPIADIPPATYRLLTSAIASAANLSTSSPDAQTGHIERTYQLADGSEVTVNLRIETVPAVHGQDAVLRLFNFDKDFMQLDRLGLSDPDRQAIDAILRHPTGLVLVVGPTGSGKTTTLYSMLNSLNNDERKIVTLEDPVEYVIEGVTQIPIQSRNQTDGFAEKLRAVLRLDPDIIMVGEIRDLDTARTALQSSLTGHLVLSTYHAGSAAAALTRMLDAIGDNPLFANAIRLITAQRLVRRLDDATKQAYEPDDQIKQYLRSALASLPEHINKPDLNSITLYRPGQSNENPFGYSGQIVLRELMQMTNAVQTVLRRPHQQIATSDIEAAAVQSGMLTMLQDGLLKALKGETTLEEVLRVIG